MAVGEYFIVLVIIVDNMAFASNSRQLLEHFKKRFSEEFDVKLFGEFKPFLGWEMRQDVDRIKVSKKRYVEGLLQRHDVHGRTDAFSSTSSFLDGKECF